MAADSVKFETKRIPVRDKAGNRAVVISTTAIETHHSDEGPYEVRQRPDFKMEKTREDVTEYSDTEYRTMSGVIWSKL